jgi:hypothetical protein
MIPGLNREDVYLPSRTGVPAAFAARLHLRKCRRTVCFCR